MATVFLTGYAVMAIGVAIWLWVYAVTTCTSEDWAYAKRELIRMVMTRSLFWPWVLATPGSFIVPTKLFEGIRRRSDAMVCRERARNPPRCGRWIRYRPLRSESDTVGEFCFLAADLETFLHRATLFERELMEEYMRSTDTGLIHQGTDVPSEAHVYLRWVAYRDDSRLKPVDTPFRGLKFVMAVEALALEGKTRVHCGACGSNIDPASIEISDHRLGGSGWIFRRTACPAGHVLLDRECLRVLQKVPRALSP